MPVAASLVSSHENKKKKKNPPTSSQDNPKRSQTLLNITGVGVGRESLRSPMSIRSVAESQAHLLRPPPEEKQFVCGPPSSLHPK